MRAQRAKIRPETADLRLRWPRGGDGGRKDRQTDRCLKIPPCFQQDISPLGPLPEKGQDQEEKKKKKERFKKKKE